MKKNSEFCKIANDYDKGRISETVDFWAEEVSTLANLDANSLVLDLGCGTGIYTFEMRHRAEGIVCGIDPEPSMLKLARKKCRGISWMIGVGEYMPIKSEVVDCIFSSQVWHHIEDRYKTAEECYRILNQKGAVIVRTISHEQLREKVVFNYFPEILPNQLMVYPSTSDFNDYFNSVGFESPQHLNYILERYQPISEFIEIAEKKLWSMFRTITEKGLAHGVEKLKQYEREHPGQRIRNDETITLVVARKTKST